jgi:hypothetical protein
MIQLQFKFDAHNHIESIFNSWMQTPGISLIYSSEIIVSI